uniref:Pre-rRNA-processing protein TSR2 homolog n=1 Tax=Parascaris univalens TaxID=6257 RepID=A0A915B7P7_PARUN
MDLEVDNSWKRCVRRLLRSWTGYQLALKMHTGGSSTSEKALWFLEVLTDYVANRHNLQEEELVDWINEILYVEFDLILEDNSSEWIAESLLKCAHWSRMDEQSNLDDFLSRLPSDRAIEEATNRSRRERSSSDDEEDEETMDDDDENEDEEQRRTDVASSRKERTPRAVTDEDGWTTILPRK